MLPLAIARRPLGLALATLSVGLGLALAMDRAAAPARAQSSEVDVTRTQLMINQRISQAAVRRANAAIERLDALAATPGPPGPQGPAGPAGVIGPGSVTTAGLAKEVKDKLPLTYFAPVQRDGDLQPEELPVPGSFPAASGVVASARATDGAYLVAFQRQVWDCARFATLVDAEPGMIAATGGPTAAQIVVKTFAPDGTPADRGFHLVVTCPVPVLGPQPTVVD
jgi:hypothetical protein